MHFFLYVSVHFFYKQLKNNFLIYVIKKNLIIEQQNATCIAYKRL